jgi:hypothetical protein
MRRNSLIENGSCHAVLFQYGSQTKSEILFQRTQFVGGAMVGSNRQSNYRLTLFSMLSSESIFVSAL